MTKKGLEPQAFQHYLTGKTLSDIGRQLDITRETLTAWKKEFNWDKKRLDLQSEADEQLKRLYSKNKVRSIQILLKGLSLYTDKLEKGEVEISPSNAEKHIILLKELFQDYKEIPYNQDVEELAKKRLRELIDDVREGKGSSDRNVIVEEIATTYFDNKRGELLKSKSENIDDKTLLEPHRSDLIKDNNELDKNLTEEENSDDKRDMRELEDEDTDEDKEKIEELYNE